jgi:hypothetical protein
VYAVSNRHRRGDVHDKDKVRVFAFIRRDFLRPDSDSQELIAGFVAGELRGRAFDMHRERLARRGSVVVVEVVDEFLRADCVPHRDVPVAEKAARDCVGSRIDVGREDGGGLVVGADERVVGIIFEENRFVRHIKRRLCSADVASRRPAGLALEVFSSNICR